MGYLLQMKQTIVVTAVTRFWEVMKSDIRKQSKGIATHNHVEWLMISSTNWVSLAQHQGYYPIQ